MNSKCVPLLPMYKDGSNPFPTKHHNLSRQVHAMCWPLSYHVTRNVVLNWLWPRRASDSPLAKLNLETRHYQNLSASLFDTPKHMINKKLNICLETLLFLDSLLYDNLSQLEPLRNFIPICSSSGMPMIFIASMVSWNMSLSCWPGIVTCPFERKRYLL